MIIEEQEGRQFASQAGLSVTGVPGVLLRAKLAGHIPAVKPEIQALRHKARFHRAFSGSDGLVLRGRVAGTPRRGICASKADRLLDPIVIDKWV